MRATRVTITGVFIAALLAAIALPAAADAAFYRIINRQVQQDIRENWCLTNSPPDVYIIRCDSRRRDQLWEIWQGGWTRNVGTGYCLNADPWWEGDPNGVYTAACIPTAVREFWRFWQGGWYQRPSFIDWDGSRVPDACLTRLYGSVHDVVMGFCDNPNGPNPLSELWYVLPA
jgi:hypothetical protein